MLKQALNFFIVFYWKHPLETVCVQAVHITLLHPLWLSEIQVMIPMLAREVWTRSTDDLSLVTCSGTLRGPLSLLPRVPILRTTAVTQNEAQGI